MSKISTVVKELLVAFPYTFTLFEIPLICSNEYVMGMILLNFISSGWEHLYIHRTYEWLFFNESGWGVYLWS